jgi:antitoxin component YwqK of YwqJK toxin-antitoxin module
VHSQVNNMKPLKALLLVALMCLAIDAQERSDADATYALKGPVRTFRVEVATFVSKDGNYVEGPRVVQMEASFNEDGNRTDLKMYNDKGVLVRRIVMKFDGRKMIEAINYDGAGKMWLRTADVYDDKGRLKEETTYNGDDSLRSKKTYQRDELGQAAEVSEYNAQGVLIDQFKNSFDGPILLTTARKVYRENGSLASTTFYEAEKKRSETTTYQPDGSVTNKTVRTAQQVEQYGPDGSLQKTSTISAEHRLVDEVVLNQDGSRKKESNAPDQLDAHGNWTKLTRWQTDSQGTRPLTVAYRTLTYY